MKTIAITLIMLLNVAIQAMEDRNGSWTNHIRQLTLPWITLWYLKQPGSLRTIALR